MRFRSRVLALLLGTLALATVLLGASPAFADIPGGQWLQGQGVDVIRARQCVELPQSRLYPKFGWPRVYAAGDGGAQYIPEGSPGLARHNPGSGYYPVPGDLIIEYATAGNPWGHVAVVDYSSGNTIFAVEQNASAACRRNYTYNGSSYAGGWGGIKAVLHAPQNGFQNPSTGNPKGALDVVASQTPGTVWVRGWDFDPDAPTLSIPVHVYIGGPAGAAGAEGFAYTANGSRPDVGAAYPGVGNNHGFDVTIATSKRGAQGVYVYAINGAGSGSNVLLGSGTVNIGNPDPVGAFDWAVSAEPGTVRVSGWDFDPNAPTLSIPVHVYIGGPAGAAGAEGFAYTANGSRPDVGAAYPGVGNNHGFDVTIATSKRGAQGVYVYAINGAGPGNNVLLGSKTVTIGTPSGRLPVYRFRNVQNGFYLWSADPGERSRINANLRGTWTEEGVAYSLNPGTNTSTLMRFRNIRGGFYLYSADPKEWAAVNDNLRASWVQEGPAYGISTNAASPPVWRFRNLRNGTYLYSADSSEKDTIVRTARDTWVLEGPAYYLAP